MRVRLLAALLLVGCPSPPEQSTAEFETAPTSGSETAAESEAAAPDAPPLTITFIDVGQGDCTLIECPDGAEILIDCGSTARGPEGRRREDVAAFLDEHVDGDLEVLVVTHPDQDHINFLAPTSSSASVLGDRRIGRAVLSLDSDEYRRTGVGGRLMDWLAASTDDVRYLTARDASPEGQPSSLFECGDANIYVLAASEPSQSSSESWQRNTPSIVLMVERQVEGGTFRAMLTGDATREAEAAILARYPPAFLDVDVLKVGHHGSLTSTVDPDNPDWNWLSVTLPAYAITTAGHHGGYLLPRCAVTDGILAAPSLASNHECHEVECAEPISSCAGVLDGAWCRALTRFGLLNSANNGDVTVTVGAAGWSVEGTRGERDSC